MTEAVQPLGSALLLSSGKLPNKMKNFLIAAFVFAYILLVPPFFDENF
jgi:hypothetical protein